MKTMITEYKITWKNIFKYSKSTIILNLTCLSLFFIIDSLIINEGIYYRYGLKSLLLILCPLFLFSIPCILVHVSYFLANRGDKLLLITHEFQPEQYNDEHWNEVRFELYHKRKWHKFKLEDIEYIEHHKTKESYHQTNALDISDYRYSVICLKNGEKFNISCLMIGDFRYLSEILNIVEVKRFLPVIWTFWN